MYEVDYTYDALVEIAELKKSDIFAYRKFDRLLKELHEHPYSGTGKPKPLKYGKKGDWSRRITDKHRLVYSVDDDKVTVLILSASKHYDDK